MANLEQFTQKARKAIQQAASRAQQLGNPEIHDVHLLEALLEADVGIIRPALRQADIDPGRLAGEVEEAVQRLPAQSQASPRISRELGRVLDEAEGRASDMGDSYTSSEHLLLALASPQASTTHEFFEDQNVNPEQLQEIIMNVRGPHGAETETAEDQYQALERFGIDLTTQAEEGDLDPVIGRDSEIRRIMQVLSRRTKNNPVLIGEAGVGKTAIVEGLAQRIARGDVPETLKEKRLIQLDVASMVAGAKYRGEFEERFKSTLKEITEAEGQYVVFIDELHTVVGAGGAEGAVDASNMLKPPLARGKLRMIGATTLDEYRQNVEKDPALERRFQPVLVEEPTVDETVSILRGLKERYEVHHGVQITDPAIVAAARLSDRYIGDRFLPDKAIDLIDEAASRLRIEMDSSPREIEEKQRRLTQLEIEHEALKGETDEESQERREEIEEEISNLKEALSGMKATWTQERNRVERVRELKERIENLEHEAEVAEREGNLERAAQITHGEIPDLREELSEAEEQLQELKSEHSFFSEEVTEELVADIVSSWTGIPVSKLTTAEQERLAHLEDHLHQRVVNQNEAIEAVSNAVRRSRAGLQDPNRPTGTFIFLGPTGVGKTETARALAEFLFDDEDKMVRLDMSEYMERHSVSRLIGSPPGYVGHEEGGQLTEKVRRHPYSVVLLDEIEKAHPEVFNSLLQVLDEGRLTDGQGRTVDFTNTVLIMTSNIASDHILKGAQQDQPWDQVEEKVRDQLHDHFRPEFLNRIDDILVYRPLTREHLVEIVKLKLQELRARLQDRDVDLEVQRDAYKLLADKGYDPAFGARPLERVIQKQISDQLAMAFVEGRVGEGDTVSIEAQQGELVVRTNPK